MQQLPTQEQLVLVDPNDQVIGTAEKLLVHQLGTLHRAFSIFLFKKQDNQLRTLLQQRQFDKYHSGGLWANSCCGHPRLNESILAAGERRTKEELGIEVKLYHLEHFIYQAKVNETLIEHELDHVLFGYYNYNSKIHFNPMEVAAIDWIKIPELESQLLNNPNKFTKWFMPAWGIIHKNLGFIEDLIQKI